LLESYFPDTFRSIPTTVRRDPISIFGRLHSAEGDRDQIPRGHHLLYFRPETPLDELGRDGSSTVSHLLSLESS